MKILSLLYQNNNNDNILVTKSYHFFISFQKAFSILFKDPGENYNLFSAFWFYTHGSFEFNNKTEKKKNQQIEWNFFFILSRSNFDFGSIKESVVVWRSIRFGSLKPVVLIERV